MATHKYSTNDSDRLEITVDNPRGNHLIVEMRTKNSTAPLYTYTGTLDNFFNNQAWAIAYAALEAAGVNRRESNNAIDFFTICRDTFDKAAKNVKASEMKQPVASKEVTKKLKKREAKGINRITDEHREKFYHLFKNGMPAQEIADRHGIHLSTTRKAIRDYAKKVNELQKSSMDLSAVRALAATRIS